MNWVYSDGLTPSTQLETCSQKLFWSRFFNLPSLGFCLFLFWVLPNHQHKSPKAFSHFSTKNFLFVCPENKERKLVNPQKIKPFSFRPPTPNLKCLMLSFPSKVMYTEPLQKRSTFLTSAHGPEHIIIIKHVLETFLYLCPTEHK